MTSPRIGDFSFAGYAMGARRIPRVPIAANARERGAKGDGITDDAPALQAALDATHDGALFLPGGRYVLGEALRIPRSFVVLRGEGPDRTVLVVPRSLAELHPEGDPLHGRLFGFVYARGENEGEKVGDLAVAAHRGDRRLTLRAPPVGLSAGTIVRLRMRATDDLLRSLLGGLAPGTQTPKDYDRYVDWPAPVASVSGSVVTLARPLRVEVRPEWNAELVLSRPTLESIGVEDLKIELSGRARSHHDAAGPGRQGWAEEGDRGIYFLGASNAWVENVEIVDADDAVTLEGCDFCQVEHVRLGATARGARSGHHGLWAKRTQDCLFADFQIETSFDHDLTVEAFANGNVFMRGIGKTMSLDHHRNAPYENLFTDLDLGTGERMWMSGGDVNRGPHAGARETLWNVRFTGAAPPLPGSLHFDRPPLGDWPLLNLVGVRGYPVASAEESIWVVELPAGIPNLYEAQRALRSCPDR